jgi:hypothetical protein
MSEARRIERIVTSTAANKTAAVVARGKGVHWEAKINPQIVHQDLPLPVVPFPGHPEHDVTGQTFGRMRVIGYAGRANSSGQGLWVVRCACGSYEHRTRKAVRGPYARRARCEACEAVGHLRRVEYFNRTGKYPEDPVYGL